MKPLLRTVFAAFLGLSLLAQTRSVSAQPSLAGQLGNAGPRPIEERPVPLGAPPPELQGIGIEDKNGATLPRDAQLVGSDGRAFALGDFMDGDRPLVLVLAYYGCPMLCSMALNAAVEGLKGAPERIGKDVRMLVVSFDPRDSTQIATEKRDNYLGSYGKPLTPINGSERNAFEFATGDPAEVKRIAEAVGFNYRWDEEQSQFAHAAGLFVVTPQGKLSQTLTGIVFESDAISDAVLDAKKGVWQSSLKSALLFCFQYNPHTGKYVLMAGRAMRVGAALTILVMAVLMFRLFRVERRKRRAQLDLNRARNLSQRAT